MVTSPLPKPRRVVYLPWRLRLWSSKVRSLYVLTLRRAWWLSARWKESGVGTEGRDVTVDLLQQIGLNLDGLGQFGVLVEQRFDVIGVLDRVQGNLGADRVGPFGGDEQCRCLDTSEHRQEQVQQYIRVGVEGLVVNDSLEEVRVAGRPENHDAEEREDEGPGPHDVAHAVGGALAQGQILLMSNAGVKMPLGLPTRSTHYAIFPPSLAQPSHCRRSRSVAALRQIAFH